MVVRVTAKMVIDAIARDDLQFILNQQQLNLTYQTKIVEFSYQIVDSLTDRPTEHVEKTHILFIAAYFGASNCFDFFFANNQWLSAQDWPRLTEMAYWGGNLVHMRHELHPEQFINALYGGYLSTYLGLIVAFFGDTDYRLPFCSISEIPILALSEHGFDVSQIFVYLKLTVQKEVVQLFARIYQWKEVEKIMENVAIPVDTRTIFAYDILCDCGSPEIFRLPWLRPFFALHPFMFWQRVLQKDNIRMVNWFCDNEPAFLTDRIDDPIYPTALHYIASKSERKVLESLLFVDEIDPNIMNSSGHPPISIAILNHQVEQVKLLLKHPFIELSGLNTPEPPLLLMIRSNLPIPEFYCHPVLDLTEELDGRMILSEIVFRTNWTAFTQIFETMQVNQVPNINAIDSNRKTLLHYAVEKGNHKFIEKILQNPRFVPYLDRMDDTIEKFKTQDPAIKKMLVIAFKKIQGGPIMKRQREQQK